MSDWRHFTDQPRYAYFSMEIGLTNEIPTYSGGLGVLAGDTIKSAADLKLPMVAVTLLSRKGYFQQSFSAGRLADRGRRSLWKPEEFMELLPGKTLVTIEGRDVKIQSWLYRVKSPTGGEVAGTVPRYRHPRQSSRGPGHYRPSLRRRTDAIGSSRRSSSASVAPVCSRSSVSRSASTI